METETTDNIAPVDGQANLAAAQAIPTGGSPANGQTDLVEAQIVDIDGSAANGKVNLVGDDNFIEEVLDVGVPVLVDFMATWCGPCKFMGPIFAELAPEYEYRVRFAKMDVDESPGVASALSIQNIPTFMLFNGRAVYAAGIGAMRPNDLRQWIEEGLQRIAENPHPGDESEGEASEAEEQPIDEE